MISLIFTLILAGFIAGLIQYFVDFKGLRIFEPTASSSLTLDDPSVKKIELWNRFIGFLRRHWQLIGYLVVGLAGAFLVPFISEWITLRGVDDYLLCIANENDPVCNLKSWKLLVILGYGIISGYSSVRLIRSLGSFLIDSLTKRQQEQQQLLDATQKKIIDLKSQVENLKLNQPVVSQSAGIHVVQNTISETFPVASHPNDDADAMKDSGISLESDVSCVENQSPKPWTIWRPAESLKTLLKQVNTLSPGRNKASDGMIGDTAHQSRDSDHNPWVWDDSTRKGIVTALDITHDPAGYCDCSVLAKSLQTNQDSRVKYVIWNRQIMNSSPIGNSAAWTWRPYSGSNPHDKHIHISVKCQKSHYDATGNWTLQC